MDETLASAALDFSGRPYFVFDGRLPARATSATCRPNWCRTSSARCARPPGLNLHLQVRGDNTHHMVEACFKAVARALRQAIRREGARAAEHQGRAVTPTRRRCSIPAAPTSARCRTRSRASAWTRRSARDAERDPRRRPTWSCPASAPPRRHGAPARDWPDRADAARLTQPLLGICVGMQLLFERSEEGDVDVPGPAARARAAPAGSARHPRAAHGLEPPAADAPRHRRCWPGIDAARRPTSCTATPRRSRARLPGHRQPRRRLRRRGRSEAASTGAQFHPERSAAAGARLLRNFLAMSA